MGAVGDFYSYFKDGKLTDEKTITAVIDISNEVIRERFPEIKEYFDKKKSI